jgi:hypothetical protein
MGWKTSGPDEIVVCPLEGWTRSSASDWRGILGDEKICSFRYERSQKPILGSRSQARTLYRKPELESDGLFIEKRDSLDLSLDSKLVNRDRDGAC